MARKNNARKAAPRGAAVRRALTKAEQFEKLTMRERVRVLGPIAADLALYGVECLKATPEIDPDAGLSTLVSEILGLRKHDYLPETDERSQNAWLVHEAAFALGIAIGLLLRPEAFTTGGAR